MNDPTRTPAAAGFRILFVCTGNLCRSPLAERMVRAWLAELPPVDAARFSVASAGTEALAGNAMDPRSARLCEHFGATASGFLARHLDPGELAGADLVLTASREHRAEALRRCPPAHAKIFTIREFGRLVAAIPPGQLPASADPVRRARLLTEAARVRRGTVRPDDPASDDIADPVGDVEAIFQTVGSAIARALAGPIGIIRGRPVVIPPEPDQLRPPPQPRRAALARWRPRLRWVVATAALAVVLVATAGGWLAWRASAAQRELLAAKQQVTEVRAALLAADPAAARSRLAEVQRHTRRARSLTSDPVWRAAGVVPFLGATPRAVRQVAAATDDLAEQALPALVAAGGALAPAQLRSSGDQLAVTSLTAAQTSLARAQRSLAAVRADLGRLPSGWVAGSVREAAATLIDEVGTAEGQLTQARQTIGLAAGMLGADGPRRYLLVLQNNAEARGTGGLPGMYAVLGVNRGRIAVERLGSDTDLRSGTEMPVPVDAAYTALWGDNPALWPNGNLDPRFDYAARIWLALWQRQTGERLDGVIATDPVAVSYLLRATGPAAMPDRESVTAANLVPQTMQAVYGRFPDPGEQDRYLQLVAVSTLRVVLSGRGDPRQLLHQLERAVRERRILLYSAHPQEQRALERTALAGTIPDTPGPFAFLVVNNLAANKMDYYLQRSLRYTAGRCVAGQRHSRIVVTLRNTAPASTTIPYYAAQRGDTMGSTLAQSSRLGAVSVWASLYGPIRGRLVAATLDGQPLEAAPGVAGQRPVWGFPVVVGQGQQRTVVLEIVEPATGGEPVVPVQPLVLPQATQVTAAPCG